MSARMLSPPVSPPAMLSSTASGGAPASGLGNRTRAAPDWCSTPTSVAPPRRANASRTEPCVRGSQERVCSTAVDPHPAAKQSDSKVAPDVGFHHGRALSRQHHLAALHHGIAVGEGAGELEVLLH